MLDIFMALWNQKHVRGLLKILFTFVLIGLSIFLVLLGMPHWSFSKDVSTIANNATSSADDSFVDITATPTPTQGISGATPTATKAAPFYYHCISYWRKARTPVHKNGLISSTQRSQSLHNSSVATTTPTPTPIVSPTPDALASAIATITTASTTPFSDSTATATVSITTIVSTATPVADLLTASEANTDVTVPSTSVIDASPSVASHSQDLLNTSIATPVTRSNRITPRSSINIRLAPQSRWGGCLSNSLEVTGVTNVVDILLDNTDIIIGGSLTGTILFYGLSYVIKRRKHA